MDKYVECGSQMRLGGFIFPNRLFVAPMAGVTDRPFRKLCRALGAGYAVSEMAASNPELWASEKSMRRLNHDGEVAPIAVQIAGSDPDMLAHAAKFNVDRGAQIIDINMGCPAKKVCKTTAGSALLRDEKLVAAIVNKVVSAVDVPVTLKFRTGWDRQSKNALSVAKIAQDAGIQMLTLHGRTRCDFYTGEAEYETIAAVKALVDIPVVANGDIASPDKAKWVLAYTKADAVMIGRAAQGRPWIFREIDHFLKSGEYLPPPLVSDVKRWLLSHLLDHYEFYGDVLGVRTARKHLIWYTEKLVGGTEFIEKMLSVDSMDEQYRMVNVFFDQMAELTSCLQYRKDVDGVE